MKRRSHRLLVAVLCTVTCASATALSLWPFTGYVRTEDHNGDGRPDVWRTYDRQAQLSEVAIDTNFDGRSDVHEYYERGALVRRNVDRNFNDRVDLVEEFDPTTREQVRSVVDTDFDGTADLLVLFQGGQPVFSKWMHPVGPAVARDGSSLQASTSQRTADDPLLPLEDPFRADLAMRPVHVPVGSVECVGLSTSGGLPASRSDVVGPLATSSDVSGSSVPAPTSATAIPHSPRGPPTFSRLT